MRIPRYDVRFIVRMALGWVATVVVPALARDPAVIRRSSLLSANCAENQYAGVVVDAQLDQRLNCRRVVAPAEGARAAARRPACAMRTARLRFLSTTGRPASDVLLDRHYAGNSSSRP
jgi:hypothetical protein